MQDWFTPIPRVLHRPNLFMGCEREWIMDVLVVAAMTAYSGLSLFSMGLGLLIWFTGHSTLLWIASADPQAIRIYLRSLKYKRHYEYRPCPYKG